ncbi:ABC transporter permease subunit [Bosea caraganae]|uniref:Glutathione transport system permease protein GsiD n=1 Tax=Bosea caraganae TaxID=2763117 RepID=A0A370L2V6_9HYPH|nr:ABC transporter permease subunit [Bosea caraganae]RDJ22400.1 ABC transporter permease subunit [Bosea caraganae]RDJ30359.1 ABC transporter permease subunit [Bosea caraganae]
MTAPAIRSPAREFWRRFRRRHTALLAAALIVLIVLAAVFAPYIAPYDPAAADYDALLQPPSAAHLAGTDSYGRDILSRIIWGGRVSLAVGLISALAGGLIGTIMGLVSGWSGGWVDALLMRLCDVLFAFPGLLLAIAVVALLGPGVGNVIWAVAVFSVPVFARLVRGSTLVLKQAQYVQAARSIGVSRFKLILHHILPGALPAVIVYMSLRIGSAILVGAALSFIGLGAQPPSSEWGAMLADGRSYLGVADHLTLFPGLAIFVVVLCFNILGDGLRDALNQKLQ